jgi:hypothetical protein
METASEMIARAKAYTAALPQAEIDRRKRDEENRIQREINSKKRRMHEECIRLNLTRVFFWGEEHQRVEEITNLQVEGWNQTEEAKICVEYLKAGEPIEWYCGWANCELCGAHLGEKDMCHENWTFPEYCEHHILAHSVKPPQAFIDSALKWNVTKESDMTVYNLIKSLDEYHLILNAQKENI